MEQEDLPISGSATAGLGVGDMLRAERIRRGQKLDDVARTLRIRLPYLQALEENRFRDLPGAAYIVGFLKTYGDYLQLDSTNLIQLYRSSGAVEEAKTIPLYRNVKVDSKFPGIGAFVAAALLLAAAYGAWYYYSHYAAPRHEIAAPGPVDNNAQQAQGNTSSASPPPSASAVTAVPATPGTAEGSAPAASAVPGPTVPAAVPAAPTDDSTTDSPGSAEGDDTNVTPATADTSAPAADAAAGNASLPPAAIYGAKDGPSRISLRATMDAWVRIDDEQGRPVWTQLMRKDEVYRVPENVRYVLTTGNAGGLEISVDGKALPFFGPVGVVKRNIDLTPEALKPQP